MERYREGLHGHRGEREHGQHAMPCAVSNRTLDSLEAGESAVIVNVGGEGILRRRLLDMGLTPRTRVMIRRVAPMGDPIELNLRGYELTLRKEDAGRISIEEEK